ncbi:MAG: carbonic anhydrase [Kofleriaceae bacterium]|nr:carbonic anhydrase [Kofleriaceae bacterium]
MTTTISPLSPRAALDRLRSGNARFAQNVRSIEALASQGHREALVAGQHPFAIILSCSDSRVPAELVFDCGLGDLFVVRVAGNVVAPSIVGSVEFATATFGTGLVVVMGHSRCGAVATTLDVIAQDAAVPSENVRDIVTRIQPAVTELVRAGGRHDQLLPAAIRANVRASANQLRRGSKLLEQRLRDGTLQVVGAEYALETGKVDFFDVPVATGASWDGTDARPHAAVGPYAG